MKTCFIFNIQSVSDIITNSSSELFVFARRTVDEVVSILDEVYPDWQNEYQSPVQVNLMSTDDLRDYLDWVYSRWEYCSLYHPEITRETSKQLNLAKHFKLDPADLYSNWETWDPHSEDYYTAYLQWKDSGVELVRTKIADSTVALYSIDDNPEWKYQDILEQYAKRYHLG